jgi:hypothetical protein
MPDDTPDLAAAARAMAATELREAFLAGPGFRADQARQLVEIAAALRVALLTNGVDLDDADQAATVCAVLASMLAVDEDPHVIVATAILAGTEAFSHAVGEVQR